MKHAHFQPSLISQTARDADIAMVTVYSISLHVKDIEPVDLPLQILSEAIAGLAKQCLKALSVVRL
jgi:hypothetical protein